MDAHTLTSFFMWMTIINGALFVCWATICVFAPDWVYRMQSRQFQTPRETHDVVIYGFFGLFKVVFIIFNLVPYLALLIVGQFNNRRLLEPIGNTLPAEAEACFHAQPEDLAMEA